MKNTIIKKINVIVSLWLIAIIATLPTFGYQLDNFGFYIAAAVFGALLLLTNSFTVIHGIMYHTRYVSKRETEYNKY